MLHGEHVAELALGFLTGGFGTPAVSDQIFRLAVDMKTQFGLYVRLRVRTENAIVSPPERDLLHEVSGVGGWVALRILATASAYASHVLVSARR
jgi:hypothetical protein